MDSGSSEQPVATNSSKGSSAANADWSPCMARKATIWQDELSHRSSGSPLFRVRCSTGSELGSRDVRFQEKRPCALATGTLKELMEPSRQSQPRPDAPRCPSPQESASLLFGQFDDAFQIHLDAGLKRSLDLSVGLTVDCDVEIGADPVPALACGVRVTPKRHRDFFLENVPFSSFINLSRPNSEATKQVPDSVEFCTSHGVA